MMKKRKGMKGSYKTPNGIAESWFSSQLMKEETEQIPLQNALPVKGLKQN